MDRIPTRNSVKFVDAMKICEPSLLKDSIFQIVAIFMKIIEWLVAWNAKDAFGNLIRNPVIRSLSLCLCVFAKHRYTYKDVLVMT